MPPGTSRVRRVDLREASVTPTAIAELASLRSDAELIDGRDVQFPR